MSSPQRKIVLALALVAAAFAWPNAGAAEIGGRPLGMVPHHTGRGSASPLASPLAVGTDERPTLGAMTYHGGRVMHTVTIHAIYWFPSGSYVDPSGLGYRGYIDRFLGDVAHDSGGFSNVYASDTEYTDTLTGHILYREGAPTSTLDTTPFPASGCTAIDPSGNPLTGEPCLTDAQIHQEVVRDAGATGYSNLYVVFLPSGIDECFDATSGTCSTNSFCAYHTGWGTLSDPLLYAVEPYYVQADPGCDPSSAGAAQDPNGNDADVVISTLSHETNEAITDPAGNAWYDASQNENGDKCAYDYGSRIGTGPSGGQYNQLINGNPYFIQLEWSNALNDCYQTGTAPTITGFSPDRGPAGTVVTVTGTSFYDQTGTVSVTLGGVAIPYTVSSPTSLHFTVPSTSAGGAITVTTIGGTVTSGSQFVVAPKIMSFSPLAAAAGATVTIYGVGFAGVDAVTFDGVAATSVTPVSATQVRAVVPPDAGVGPIVVSTATGASDPFGTFKPLPRITSFTPEDGDPASPPTVAITGTNLLGASSVKFGTLAASFASASATELDATVPGPPFSSGRITVVTPAGSAVSPGPFSYTKVTSVLPSAAAAGSTVTIAGQGLSATTGIDFAGHSGGVAPFGTPTATAVRVVVPDDATSGALTVVTPRASVSTPAFRPLPRITDVSPLDGKAGTPVTITGTNLSDVSSVKFGTTSASFTPVSATEVDATVPGGTFSSGRVTVVTPGGSAVSTQLFGITKVTSFTASAAAGATITLSGQGLSTATSVDFAGDAGIPVSGTPTATSVKIVVPDDATTGPLTVHTPQTDPGGVTTATSFRPLPRITSISPLDGKAGTAVTITGTNLLGATSVKFGTTSASFTPVSATEVDATVPAAPFSSGRVTIVTPGGTAVSAQLFAVTKVTTATPAAAAGATVTISGQGLSSATTVDFDGHPGVAVSRTTATSVRVVVPNDATVGPLTVHTPNIDPSGLATTTQFKPLPKITTVSPNPAQPAQSVTIAGTNLADVSSLKLGALTITPDTSGATTLTFTVPDNAVTGTLTLATTGGTAATTLKVVPRVDGFATGEGAAGDNVVVDGAGFSGISAVRFTGATGTQNVAGLFRVLSPTQLQVTVPTAAVSGPIAITNAGGTSDSGPFAVDPKITSFTPTSAATGATVSVYGSGFGTSAGALDLEVGGVPAAGITSVTPTLIRFVVPNGAATGPISVSVGGSPTATSSQTFNVTFSATSFTSIQVVGGDVTIHGFGLAGVTSVTFGRWPASIDGTPTDTSLDVEVPPDLAGWPASQPIAITLYKGSALTVAPGSFTVLQADTTNPIVPNPVVPGSSVTIHGTGFLGATGVAFGNAGSVAPSSINSDGTQLTATVPSGFTGGQVTITAANGTTLTVELVLATFRIASVGPGIAGVGGQVTITGSSLADATAVEFNGVSVSPTYDSNTQTLTADVPATATSGPLSIVGPAGTATSSSSFTVVTLSATSGTAGDTVVITGAGFTGATGVDFGGAAATFTVDSDTQITATVPAGAATGAEAVHVTPQSGDTIFAGTYTVS